MTSEEHESDSKVNLTARVSHPVVTAKRNRLHAHYFIHRDGFTRLNPCLLWITQ
jgi:hypothetical protein